VRRSPRSALVAAAFAAALVAGTTSASAATPVCHLSDLRLVRGSEQGTAGHFHLAIVFVNRSTHTCRLSGFPGVSSVGSGGVQIGSPASWDHSIPPTAVTVVLHPGGRGHADYTQTDPGVFDPSTCRPTAAPGLRVYPPGSTLAGHLAWDHQACDEHGLDDSSVRRVVPGPG